MTIMDNLTPAQSVDFDNPAPLYSDPQPCSLRQEVERSLQTYFEQLGNESVTGLYDLVLAEVEAPLLEAVLRHTGSNQSKASIMLGLNRGTLRKKLKQYGLL
jgi:Fis family transcriptional regulator, factor for inversion stimulation protein